MRNTTQYPLRDDEVQSWLDRKLEEYQASGLIGGMDGVIISHLKALASAHSISTETETTTAKD